MSEAPSYPIDTITEMAAIPAEAWPRLAAELPALLAEINRVRSIATIFNGMFDGALTMDAGRGITWIDDGKGEATTTVSMDGMEEAISITRKIGEAA